MLSGDAAIIALLVTVLSITALRPVAIALGLVDRPGGRKRHQGDVPVIGGLCLFFGFAIGILLLDSDDVRHTPLLIAAAVLVVVGTIDDGLELSPAARLIAQTIAALILCLSKDLTVTHLGDLFLLGDVPLGPFALPFTVLVIMTVTNAFNMLDGMDGLAGGVAFTAMLCAAFAVLLYGTPADLGIAVIAMAGLAGFLIFNIPGRSAVPLRTFMGDAGATLLGFIVVWLGLRLSAGPAPAVPAVVVLWIAAIPVFDLFLCFGRRIARGRNPLTADRGHLHHVLSDAGLTDGEVVATIVVASLILGLTGILAHRAGIPDSLLFAALLLVMYGQFVVTRNGGELARRFAGRRVRAY